MTRKKIGLYLGAEPSGGGTFQYNQAMLAAVANLPSDKYEVVVAYSSTTWLKYFQPYSFNTCYNPRPVFSRIISSACRNFKVSLAIWRKLHSLLDPFAKRLLKQNCDLWIFPSQDLFSYTIDVPSLATVHDLMHRYEKIFPELSAKGEFEAREFHYSKMTNYSKGILVDSLIGKQHVIESYGVEKDKIHILPFIAPGYIYSDKMPLGFDTKYDLPEKFIFYPAQFWEHKNHKGLIKAAALVKSEYPDFKLVFVGSKKNGYKSAQDLVFKLGLSDSVTFLGYVPDEDMPELYRRATAMIMASFCGPTNIPPLEAFVTGCPLAVSNVYAMPEQVGDAAMLFDPASSHDIARVLGLLWANDDLCKKLSDKGSARSNLFDTNTFNSNLENIVSSIC